MKINCLSCGHNIDLDDSYSDYEGLIKCFACGATLKVKLVEGCIKAVKFPDRVNSPVTKTVNESGT
jgi:DNA-directed RNA polymerase subunit N (RpoN/RPB10)